METINPKFPNPYAYVYMAGEKMTFNQLPLYTEAEVEQAKAAVARCRALFPGAQLVNMNLLGFGLVDMSGVQIPQAPVTSDPAEQAGKTGKSKTENLFAAEAA